MGRPTTCKRRPTAWKTKDATMLDCLGGDLPPQLAYHLWSEVFREAEIPQALFMVDHRHDRRHQAHGGRLPRVRVAIPVGGSA